MCSLRDAGSIPLARGLIGNDADDRGGGKADVMHKERSGVADAFAPERYWRVAAMAGTVTGGVRAGKRG
jgi:hypothetical protein